MLRTPPAPSRISKRQRQTPDSSDTDNTPPRKKSRLQAHTAIKPESDLEELLRHQLYSGSDSAAILELKSKNINNDQSVLFTIRSILDSVKAGVSEEIRRDGEKILEVELYLRWLQGSAFVVNAIDNVLNAKVPGTRRRVPGLGRVSFSILYHLLEEFINEVNSHQDGWSHRYPAGPIPLDPLVMTLAEEANDTSTDDRSERAVKCVEDILRQYDVIMAGAVCRYKSESNKKLMAASIGRKEDSLEKGCCLLSEQTGYGSTDDMGFNLLMKTRTAMGTWRAEFEVSDSH